MGLNANRLIVVGTNDARQVSLESLPVVNNGARYEEDAISRIREDTRSGSGTLHLCERQMGCVQNTEITCHQCTVPCNDGDLAGVGKVRGGSTAGRPADGATSRAMKLVAPSSGPAPVMAPVVQSPTGLVQFCVVNTLRIVPLTRLHRSSAEAWKVVPDCFMGKTTADSPRPKISSKRSLPTCFIVFFLCLQIFFDPTTRIDGVPV